MNLELASRVLAGLSFLSFGLTFWRWRASARFPLHDRLTSDAPLPGCTILKPLKGFDSETKSCLRTWLAQNYAGPAQILFGVASADDPVCRIALETIAEFSHADARLVLCGENLGVNAKISTLRQLEPLIAHPLVIISDADVSVPADFLSNIAPPFTDAGIGLVNCFYRLAQPATLAMQWEAVAINADFWTQVLQAQSLKKVDFALGAVMALPASQLQAIGGFAVLSDFLADDYELGQAIARQGQRIVFSPLVVDCHDAPMNWSQVWAHQVRWARTIRACQPLPFFFSVLDNATFWPLLWLVVSGHGAFFNIPIVSICFIFFAFRIVTAMRQQSRLTRCAAHFGYFWMVPIKDLLNMAVWAAAFLGNRIQWRGQSYRVLKGGRLEKAG